MRLITITLRDSWTKGSTVGNTQYKTVGFSWLRNIFSSN